MHQQREWDVSVKVQRKDDALPSPGMHRGHDSSLRSRVKVDVAARKGLSYFLHTVTGSSLRPAAVVQGLPAGDGTFPTDANQFSVEKLQ